MCRHTGLVEPLNGVNGGIRWGSTVVSSYVLLEVYIYAITYAIVRSERRS